MNNKYIVIVSYTGIMPEGKFFKNKKDLIEYIESLRPGNKRPNHIIIEGMDKEEVDQIQKDKLYACQVFCLENNTLFGGTDYTRKFLCNHYKYKDGGKIEDEIKLYIWRCSSWDSIVSFGTNIEDARQKAIKDFNHYVDTNNYDLKFKETFLEAINKDPIPNTQLDNTIYFMKTNNLFLESHD